MRSRSLWHRGLTEQLSPTWPSRMLSFTPGDLLNVEFGLFLLERVMPGHTAADAWTLFGGYPYGEAFGDIRSDAHRLMVRRARHYLWPLRRRRVWHNQLRDYQAVPQELRGYDVKDIDAVPQRRTPSRAPNRFVQYDTLLAAPPAHERTSLPIAQAGEYWFPVRDRRYSVVFTEDLVQPGPDRHDLTRHPTNNGAPITVTLPELADAAAQMDAIEVTNPQATAGHWSRRLARVELLVRADENRDLAEFTAGQALTVDRVLHLVGMVGAGKSTLRDILAYWCAKNRMRITVVVGDVAEALTVVRTFTNLNVPAAPILGHSTRERHIQRLHRRLATSGAPSMLAHDHQAFAHVNSACPVDALRGLEADTPLRIAEAPCTQLYPTDKQGSATATVLGDDEQPGGSPGSRRRPQRHGCPLWSRCPRHHSARELVEAAIWVATPASLIHSGVPGHQVDELMRYLELACLRSDLIIVDEADRVQMHLDTAFAPATTLVGRGAESWLDEVHSHKITELARMGRLQLSQQFIDDWINAFNTMSIAADRLYGMLTRSKPLRDWIVADYFSAYTLHHWLLNAWFPDVKDETDKDREGAPDGDRVRQRDAVSGVLDAFRDQPLQPNDTGSGDATIVRANQLVALTLELLHSHHSAGTHERLRETLLELVDHDPRVVTSLDRHALQFEFSLLLAALHHRLDFVTTVWPRVEAALNLESTSNVLSRRPPKDYEPIVPESPMGNVLGFQFQLDDQQFDGGQSGALRFFRCSGLGRDLLLNLHDIPRIDGRPGPNVLLMSATSWAGSSSRYHIDHPVGAVLRPHPDEVAAVLGTTFRKEFLYTDGADGGGLRLSGTEPQLRAHVLAQMLKQLAEPGAGLAGATSKLADELADIADPDRRRILLLVGSYAEARRAGSYLNAIPEWNGRVSVLVSDDADLDDVWHTLPRDSAVRTLRRGDVASFAITGADILIAPLLAVERGHNIVIPGGKAAIGSVYFLARPHPRPDDINLAIQAINDWAVRYVRGGQFRLAALAAGTPDAAGLEFRRLARRKWQRFLTRRLSWTSLPDDEKQAFTWDQMVIMWQVIGRLVRGGVPARVVFVDAAFAPKEAGLEAVDTPDTSLLLSIREALHPYFAADSHLEPIDRSLVQALYEPLYNALLNIDS